MNELKTSVSEGKALVAAAVTDKGVSTAADATFALIAENIESLETNKVWIGTVSSAYNSTSITITCGFKPKACVAAMFNQSFYEGVVCLAWDGTTAYYQYGVEESGDDTLSGGTVTATVTDTGITFGTWSKYNNESSNKFLVICVG